MFIIACPVPKLSTIFKCFVFFLKTLAFYISYYLLFISVCLWYVFHVSIEAPSREVCIPIPASVAPATHTSEANKKGGMKQGN